MAAGYTIKHRDEFESMEGSGDATFASIEPPARRTVLNRSEVPVTALLIGVHPSGEFKPSAWA